MTEEERIEQYETAARLLGEVLAMIRGLQQAAGQGPEGRALALAVTKTEESLLWLRQAYLLKLGRWWLNDLQTMREIEPLFDIQPFE